MPYDLPKAFAEGRTLRNMLAENEQLMKSARVGYTDKDGTEHPPDSATITSIKEQFIKDVDKFKAAINTYLLALNQTPM